jgi:hypothetical protein
LIHTAFPALVLPIVPLTVLVSSKTFPAHGPLITWSASVFVGADDDDVDAGVAPRGFRLGGIPTVGC